MWEIVKTKAGKTGVAKAKGERSKRRSRKETRREGREKTEKKVEKREDD